MATIRPNSLIDSISGAVCKHDDTYYATNSQTGKTYAVRRCFPSNAKPTEKQLAHRAKFGNLMKAAAAWINANKPTESNQLGTADYQAARKAYASQHKIGSFSGYVAKYVVNATSTPQGGTTPDPDAPLEL